MNRTRLDGSAPAWKPIPGLLFFLIFAAPLLAQETRYLDRNHSGALAALSPPPAPGSPEEAADIASARAIRKTLTPAAAKLAEAEKKFSVFYFAPVLGPFFQADQLPRTEAFFRRVEQETDEIANAAKDHWQRPRPAIRVKRTHPGVAGAGETREEGKSLSYPSGHSTRATVYAELLAKVFPDRQDALLAAADSIGWHRVMIGKHYPTDIYAGRVLARVIVRELEASAAFQRDFADMQAELSAAQPPPAPIQNFATAGNPRHHSSR